MKQDTDTLAGLLAEATPGPWHLHDCESYDGRSTSYYQEVWTDNLDVIAAEVYRAHNDGGRANMRLIALSPTLAAEVVALRAQATKDKARIERLQAALREIAGIKEREKNCYPPDWREQIEACPECRRYKDHPIQRGICDDHRKPIYAQEDHNRHETKILGYRAKDIARAALEDRE